jgi:hypothetical protein
VFTWTDEAQAVLRRADAQRLSAKVVARELGCPVRDVYEERSRLGLARRHSTSGGPRFSVRVYLTRTQRRRLEDAAALAGMSLSDYVGSRI